MSNMNPITASHPNGHFYSPVVNPEELMPRAAELWPDHIPECVGIHFNDRSHRRILKRYFKRYIRAYDYPEHQQSESSFYTQNAQFSWLDSRALFVLMQAFKPRRIIEVGSGFSSLLMADVNTRFLHSKTHITCIEPYPRSFLTDELDGLNEVIVAPVQDVPVDRFQTLSSGDVLFIDSSHVSKTGSDLNYMLFQVIPRLKRGVYIHLHDIFLPAEYPKSWVLEDNRSWNEQYLLHALLTLNKSFKVIFGCNYAEMKFPELLRKALGFSNGRIFGGGSFWIRKTV